MHIPGAIKRHWLITTLVLVIATPVRVFTIWTTTSLHYTYSEGDRAGYLLKISKRGWLCKTWEGELQQTAIPGAAPDKFLFTTRSDSIAGELTKLAGQRVSLHYQQHTGVPTSCFGDTEYYVTGVRAVGS